MPRRCRSSWTSCCVRRRGRTMPCWIWSSSKRVSSIRYWLATAAWRKVHGRIYAADDWTRMRRKERVLKKPRDEPSYRHGADHLRRTMKANLLSDEALLRRLVAFDTTS